MTSVRTSTSLEALTERRRVRPQPLPGTDRPTVTVVIPCFNYARFLATAVGSVLTQTGVDVNVIVVDDASTDDSVTVACALADADERVRVMVHAENQGPVATFNDGLELASGEFLVRLDADDMLTPGSLARAVAVARAFPSVGLVYGHPLHFVDTPPVPRQSASTWTLWPGLDWVGACCRTGFNVITSPEVLMRRSVVAIVGGQRDLPHTHDMEMWLRLAAFSDVAHIEGADQAWHREHPASLSGHVDSSLKDLVIRRDAFDALFDGRADVVDPGRHMANDARVALARDALFRARRAAVAGADTEAREHVSFARGLWERPPEWVLQEVKAVEMVPSPWQLRIAVFRERAMRRMRRGRSWRRWNRWGMW